MTTRERRHHRRLRHADTARSKQGGRSKRQVLILSVACAIVVASWWLNRRLLGTFDVGVSKRESGVPRQHAVGVGASGGDLKKQKQEGLPTREPERRQKLASQHDQGDGNHDNDAVALHGTNAQPLPTTASSSHLSPQNGSAQTTSERHHMIFSSSCGNKQDWQAYLFFFQAKHVQQPGSVTRIVSGCTETEQKTLQAKFEKEIAIMSTEFHIHFTPPLHLHQDGKAEKNWEDTKYWNKPFGAKHWLEATFGYSEDTRETAHDHDIVILVDPDMLLQRPIVNDFRNIDPQFWLDTHVERPNDIVVSMGNPVGQTYAFGDDWFVQASKNMSHVVGDASPVHDLTNDHDSMRFYAVGPPYILTLHDMYKVSELWCEYLPRLWDIYSHFMAEMYAYCLATAHLGLKHNRAQGLMMSHPQAWGEGWYALRNATKGSVCQQAMDLSIANRPHVLHYCQRYSIGEFFFSKYRTHHRFLQCDQPLVRLPSVDVAKRSKVSKFGDGTTQRWERGHQIGHAYAVCAIYPAMNRAARYFKQTQCGSDANLNETWNFFETEYVEEDD